MEKVYENLICGSLFLHSCFTQNDHFLNVLFVKMRYYIAKFENFPKFTSMHESILGGVDGDSSILHNKF